MSYKDFLVAVDILESGILELDFSLHPQSLEAIEQAEKTLEVLFSRSFKEYLIKYGVLAFRGIEIFGMRERYNAEQYVDDNIICVTLDERKTNIDPRFPHSLIPIHALGNGELSCLDTAQMNEQGECPVVAWYFGPTKPGGKFEVLAEDFGAFLLEKVQWGLESLREEKEGK